MPEPADAGARKKKKKKAPSSARVRTASPTKRAARRATVAGPRSARRAVSPAKKLKANKKKVAAGAKPVKKKAKKKTSARKVAVPASGGDDWGDDGPLSLDAVPAAVPAPRDASDTTASLSCSPPVSARSDAGDAESDAPERPFADFGDDDLVPGPADPLAAYAETGGGGGGGFGGDDDDQEEEDEEGGGGGGGGDDDDDGDDDWDKELERLDELEIGSAMALSEVGSVTSGVSSVVPGELPEAREARRKQRAARRAREREEAEAEGPGPAAPPPARRAADPDGDIRLPPSSVVSKIYRKSMNEVPRHGGNTTAARRSTKKPWQFSWPSGMGEPLTLPIDERFATTSFDEPRRAAGGGAKKKARKAKRSGRA